MAFHRQVPIGILGQSFTVDVGIAPLIRGLWNQGYRTTGSCEDQDGIGAAWIGFETRAEAERFAVMVGDAAEMTIIEPTAEDFASGGLGDDDPALRGAIGVGFRPWEIQAVLAAVRAA